MLTVTLRKYPGGLAGVTSACRLHAAAIKIRSAPARRGGQSADFCCWRPGLKAPPSVRRRGRIPHNRPPLLANIACRIPDTFQFMPGLPIARLRVTDDAADTHTTGDAPHGDDSGRCACARAGQHAGPDW